MLKSIIVPTDGSIYADKAIELAASISAKYKAKIILVHAIPTTDVPEELKRFADAEHLKGPPTYIRYKYVAEGIMREAKRKAEECGAEDIETVFADGDPATAIIKEARDRNVDMIVMGSRGLSNLKGLLMGSVTRKVSELASCTCVTVK